MLQKPFKNYKRYQSIILADNSIEEEVLMKTSTDTQIKIDPTKYVVPSKEGLRVKLSDMQFRITYHHIKWWYEGRPIRAFLLTAPKGAVPYAKSGTTSKSSARRL